MSCSAVRSAMQTEPGGKKGTYGRGRCFYLKQNLNKVDFAHCSLTVSLSLAPEKCDARICVHTSHTRAEVGVEVFCRLQGSAVLVSCCQVLCSALENESNYLTSPSHPLMLFLGWQPYAAFRYALFDPFWVTCISTVSQP